MKRRLCLLLVTLIISSGCDNSQRTEQQPEIQKESVPFRITWTDYSGRGVAIKKIVDEYNQNSDQPYEITRPKGTVQFG